MNIKELDDLNIKAILYDLISEKELIQENINRLKEELIRREADREEKKKGEQ
jgi:hypothetical protein